MSDKNHENLTTNFDCIYCQNFSMKIKFIFGFFFLIYIDYVSFFFFFFFFEGEIDYISCLHNTQVLNFKRKFKKKNCMPNTRKYSQAYFQCHYQTPENKIVFQKILFKKWTIFQKTLILKQSKYRREKNVLWVYQQMWWSCY